MRERAFATVSALGLTLPNVEAATLVRPSRIDPDALRDLLSMSKRLTLSKAKVRTASS